VDFTVAATTFALVIPAELPDKTFISCIVLSSRHRPLPVWLGAASALILQSGLAVVAGRLLSLLPKVALRSVVGALFLGGAVYLLVVPERSQQVRGEKLAEGGEKSLQPTPVRFWRVVAITFGIVAVAEFGDITQVLIANLAARDRDPAAVFLGSAVAFVLISVVGVLAGRTITRFVPLATVRRLSGLALLALGIYSFVALATT
jgi:Ca2+/H+ antiporter, TMEM165/GDT1 family